MPGIRRKPDMSLPEYKVIQRAVMRFAKERHRLGLTQAIVGVRSGYSQSGVCSVENMKTTDFALVAYVRLWLAMAEEAGWDDIDIVVVPRKNGDSDGSAARVPGQ